MSRNAIEFGILTLCSASLLASTIVVAAQQIGVFQTPEERAAYTAERERRQKAYNEAAEQKLPPPLIRQREEAVKPWKLRLEGPRETLGKKELYDKEYHKELFDKNSSNEGPKEGSSSNTTK